MAKIGLLSAAFALAAPPVLAQSLPSAMPLTGQESEVGDGGAGIIAAALIAGIVAIGVIAAADGDDAPVSA